MKYYIKRNKKEEGPYSQEELKQLLNSLNIGTKTLCKPVNNSEKHFEPLNKVVPEVISAVEKQRANRKKTKIENLQPKTLDITLTTESYPKDLTIEKRLGIVSSESALGMNVFKDFFTNIRDLVGGQSVSTQKTLKSLKENAFKELKKQAANLDANAVIGIDLDYSEFSGAGRSMLFLVVTGTAVKLKEETLNEMDT